MVRQPLTKEQVAIDIVNELAERLANKQYFLRGEQFRYNSRMNIIKRDEHSASHLAWAYFYACSDEQDAATKYFKSAVSLDPNRMVCVHALIGYYLQTGRVSDAFNLIASKESLLLNNITLASSLQYWMYLISSTCDIEAFYSVFKNNNKNMSYYTSSRDQSIAAYFENVLSRVQEAEVFRSYTGFERSQFDALKNIYISIADDYKFEDVRLSYECYEDHDIYSLVIYTSTYSAEQICNANFELAEQIARNPIFGNAKFGIMFDYLETNAKSFIAE